MDIDLRKPAGHLREHGPHFTLGGAGPTLQTANPVNEALTEEIATAQYRRCEVCHEMGADVITRMLVADTGGGDHTSYAHSGCAEAITP